MLGYVMIGTNDIDKALAFYDTILGECGGKRLMDHPNGQIYGFAQGGMIGVVTPYDKKPATVGNGMMVALNVGTAEKVDAIYNKALELGGSCEGEPGERMDGFYGAYFRDLDGNKLCAFAMAG